MQQALTSITQKLGLSTLAGEVLMLLGELDIDPQLTERYRVQDPYNRSGILSWTEVRSSVGVDDLGLLNAAIGSLNNWGLIEAVGHDPSDPNIPGPTALRLTYAGRTCLQQGPLLMVKSVAPGRDVLQGRWLVLHSACRESTYLCALKSPADRGSEAAPLPLRLPAPGAEWRRELHWFLGQVALQLLESGLVVVDAYGLAEPLESLSHRLTELIRRTSSAPGVRILLMEDPSPVRWALLSHNVQVRWVRPSIVTRRRDRPLSAELSDLLFSQSPELSPADVHGMHDSRLVQPRAAQVTLADLVLPGQVRRRLQLCSWHARSRVKQSLELARALARGSEGYRLLLAGPPGTGKSMAAEALASELEVPFVRFDLSTVLSKWLGETERLLSEVFDLAESVGALLAMDEAETLMSQRRRSDSGGALVTGVSYLLTRFESYQGVLVATTNHVDVIDDAFYRRFDDSLVIPMPDEAARRELWRRMLERQPGADDIDLDFLAQRFPMGGALIRGATQRALAWADAMRSEIYLELLLASLALEFEKSNRDLLGLLPPDLQHSVRGLLEESE